MRIALAGLVLAVIAIAIGWTLSERVQGIADRAEQAMAIYENGMLTFTTSAGEIISVPREDPCKFYSKPPASTCIAFYANGDEVAIAYDSADPEHTWFGRLVPGGYGPTLLLWGGIALGIFSLLWLWFASPCYQKLRRPEIAGQAPLPSDVDSE